MKVTVNKFGELPMTALQTGNMSGALSLTNLGPLSQCQYAGMAPTNTVYVQSKAENARILTKEQKFKYWRLLNTVLGFQSIQPALPDCY